MSGCEAVRPTAGVPTAPGDGHRYCWLGGLLLLFSIQVFPALFAGLETMAPAHDQRVHHLPQIDHFIAQPFDLADYPASSATTPGHHLLLAWSARLLGFETVSEAGWIIALISALFGHGLIVLAFESAYRLCRNARHAAIVMLPLACSSYVVAASIWIVTDNGALFFFAASIFALLFMRDRLILVGTVCLLMVFWRQIYLPAVGAFCLPALRRERTQADFGRAVAALVPALLLVGFFVWTWGGLTPPIAQSYNSARFQVAVPLQAFALAGLFSFPFLLFFEPAWRYCDRRRFAWVCGFLAAAVLLLWLAGTTSPGDEYSGRSGSMVWLFATRAPLIEDRSPIVLLLAWIGAAAMSLMAVAPRRGLPGEDDGLRPELMIMGLYLVGYCGQIMAWQRYVEPAFFLTFGLFAARQASEIRPLAWWGPLLLALVFAALGQARIWGLVGKMLG